ncbi:hypothetical protein ppKF707_1621 [Metapseudomonas furukawaii]|nr:hypothetical protein ppKF707_1621 [Pseudomonas furukawaii]
MIVEADDGNAPNRARGLDPLDWLTCHRQVQPSFYSDHRFRLNQDVCPE